MMKKIISYLKIPKMPFPHALSLPGGRQIVRFRRIYRILRTPSNSDEQTVGNLKIRRPIKTLWRDTKRILLIISLIMIATTIIGKDKVNVISMALIPAGTYTPLYVDDTTNQSIQVDSFLIDKYPVTNKEFLDFVIANPKWQRNNVASLFSDDSYLSHWQSDTILGPNVNPDSPVTNISWFAAKAYARYQGKRLPTVAEWELTGMADEQTPNGYDNPKYVSRILRWYSKPNASSLPSVGLVFENYYGVYDMHGLVWEWTADYFNALVTGESRANSGINRNLFCGSGSVGATDFTNYPAFMRFAFRSSLKGNYTTSNLGFRCAKDIN